MNTQFFGAHPGTSPAQGEYDGCEKHFPSLPVLQSSRLKVGRSIATHGPGIKYESLKEADKEIKRMLTVSQAPNSPLGIVLEIITAIHSMDCAPEDGALPVLFHV